MYEIEIDPPAKGSSTSAPQSWSQFEPDMLDDLSEASLDELPFGVVCLDPQGTILRYNLAESRLARFDRANVLGKNFFRQVAPCTARPQFQGRFDEFQKKPAADRTTERFTYLFDFKFGAQLVTVELARGKRPGRTYLMLNRTQILPLRPEADAPAPALSELEGEAPGGVLRDRQGGRFVRLNVAALQSLHATVVRLGVDTSRLFSEWGSAWGRLAMLDLEALALEEHRTSLRGMRLGDAIDLCARAYREQGWGEMQVDLGAVRTAGVMVVRVERSAVFEALRSPPDQRHAFTEGYLRALFSSLADRQLAVRRLPAGDVERVGQPTLFLVLDSPRLAHLEPLLQPGAPLSTVLEQLARELP